MKKLITLSIILLSFYSCSSDDCASQAKQATDQYNQALQYSGGNTAAMQKITNEYNAKMNDIYSKCR